MYTAPPHATSIQQLFKNNAPKRKIDTRSATIVRSGISESEVSRNSVSG
jgi:hypothetical protein